MDDGGDIIRLEFLLEEGEKYLKEGTYTVMDTKYEYSYAPFKMMKGYFNTNDLTGTRYMHFEEGRYYIMDHYAPVESGSVGVTCNPDGTYRFDIALMCDANFHIDGTWSGPVELMYNPENITSGIDGIESDSLRLEIVYLDKDTLELIVLQIMRPSLCTRFREVLYNLSWNMELSIYQIWLQVSIS